MKNLWMILLLVCSTSAFSMDKVIYGDDDRLDISDVSLPPYQDLARGTAAMISSGHLIEEGDKVKIKWGSLEDMGICSEERFAKQPSAANCSGFLVAPDILVTAGHCVQNMNDCTGSTWVFDYSSVSETNGTYSVPKQNLYSCKEIIKQELSRETQSDFAVIRLSRNVTDRTPLNIRREGKIADYTPLVVIGHPSGLPTKVADNAYVRKNDHLSYFVTNLDTFGGNSGSAVFDATSGVVEGILVRGENDYLYDYQRGCRVPKKCQMNECRGEDVTRITLLSDLIPLN